MLARSCLVVAALLALACGESAGDAPLDWGTSGSSTQAGAENGGSVPMGGGGSAGGGDAATAGTAPSSSGTDAGGAPQQGGQGGGAAGAEVAGGQSPGGGAPNSGGGGATQGGGGGHGGDPLEPQPVDGCPGYVKVTIPHGTCVWFSGTFTMQTPACTLTNPASDDCATVSAVSAETSSVVSEDAEITRYDFNETGCPKTCN